jgi:hypothetical protein
MGKNNSEIKIDESSHRPAPGLKTKFINSLKALFMGFILAQVILFSFGFRLILFWWDTLYLPIYLAICCILGWFYGERFIETLSKKAGDLFNSNNIFR